MPKNWCFQIVVLGKTLESPLGSKIKPVHPKRKSALSIHWKDWCWSWSSIALATWHEELTYWKKLWCWESLKANGEKGSRWWGGQMASLTQQTWVWVNSRRRWRAGKPGVLQSMRWQRLGHSLVTEQQQQAYFSLVEDSKCILTAQLCSGGAWFLPTCTSPSSWCFWGYDSLNIH